MNVSVLRRSLIAAAVVAGFLATPTESYAIIGWLKSWCQPATPCAQPVQVAQYVPQTAYRAQYVNVPVTTYKPVASCGPCGGSQVSYMPVTTVQQQVQMVPYTTYKIMYSNVTSPVVTANYQVAGAPVAAPVAQASCCQPAAAATTYYPGAAYAAQPTTAYYGARPNGYSAYSAPVYNGAGFGPPSAGLPVDNSSGNLMQSATTGSSLRGISPTLSPGSPFASGMTNDASFPPQGPSQVIMQGQDLHAPAAAMPSQGTYQQAPSQQGYPGTTYSSPVPNNGANYPSRNDPRSGSPAPAEAPSSSHVPSQGFPANGTAPSHGQPATSDAARPVTPPAIHAAPSGNHPPVTAPASSALPENSIKPIPHETPNTDSSNDPTSGPSIFPPASRTTQSPERGWSYSRLSYLPGNATADRVERASAPAVPSPAASSDGWQASSR